ncbi:glycosyltransferase family 4 protein [Haloarchaeobius sp. FL176]|uniref:glycosyltransferase family 4 protein n=1 Tax=Haloarchaeobius sp. FL176 TaxID=2967129 RepID=UPI00214908F2|nr:glycosyltransferase family 4 protein [Haloarchaeobius sp. FL176]
MKIGIVTPRYPPNHAGGGEISVQLLANQLHSHETVNNLEVFSFDGTTTETVEGVQVSRLSDVPQYPYSLPNEIAYRKLKSVDRDFDLLHAYNMHLHPAVGRLAAERDIPTVATLNAYPLLDWASIGVTPSLQRRLYESTVLRLERPRLRKQIQQIELLLPLSSAVERVYRENGFDGPEYEVVPNMLDPEFELPTNIEGDSTELLYVGYLRDSKGVRYLIDAMKHVSSDLTLKIVGDGPTREALETRVSEMGLSNRVRFTGQVPYEEVTRSYATADVFVHPGVWPEPFGRTILEAMQAGLPVVATNVGGPAETIKQQEMLCPPADPVSMADAIEQAYDRRDEYGAKNREYVRATYHPDVVVPQFVSAYERLL